jgi:signal transduction histidine kinase
MAIGLHSAARLPSASDPGAPPVNLQRQPMVDPLLKAVETGLVLMDRTGELRYLDPRAREMVGEAGQGPDLAATWREVRAAVEDQADVLLSDSLPGGSITAPGAGARRLCVRGQRLDGRSGDGYLLALSDLATLEALRAELRQAARFRSRERVNAVRAHDLRSLVNGATLTLQLLKETLADAASATPELAHKCDGYVDTVLNELHRLARLAGDALDPRAESQDQPLEFDGRQLVEAVAEQVVPLSRERRLALNLDLARHAMPLAGHRDRLEHALAGIVVSLIDATEEGGSVAISLVQVGEQVVIQVDGTGSGIPPALLARIWEPQAADGGPWAGTGLYVAWSEVQEHQGSVRAWNRPEGGVAFEIRLPIATRTSSP